MAMFATFAPLIALATSASAAAPPAPQSTTAFCAGGPSGNPFPDVTDTTDPHYANIACAKDAAIVQGKADGLYHETDDTSRAQMASLLAREADKSVALAAPGKTLHALTAAGSNPFVDVGDPPSNGGTPTAPHTNNILRLQASGITQGTDSSHYSPANPVTRFQMAKFEVAKLEFVTGTTLAATCGATFPDGAETDPTFGTFVEKAACAGIIQGKSDGSFHGGDTVTRGQTATFDIRGMAWEMSMGFITALHPSSAGTLTVSGGSVLPLTEGTSTTFKVAGAPAGSKIDLQLFKPANAPGAPGSTPNCSSTVPPVFPNSTNPGFATNNFAVPNAPAVGNNAISVVNGATEPTGQTAINGVTPDGSGNINLTVQNNDTSGTAAPSVFCLVAFVQGTGGNADQLALGANNQPSTQAFGVSGLTAFFPKAAASGTYNPLFVLIAIAPLHEFVGCATVFGGSPCNTFDYSSNANTYMYFQPTVPASQTDFSNFVSGISTAPNLVFGDGLNVAYQPPTTATPNTTSSFTFLYDTPSTATGLKAVVTTVSGTPAIQITGTSPLNLDVTSPTNPGSISILKSTVTNNQAGPFTTVGLINGNTVAAGATFTFNDLNPGTGIFEYEAIANPNGNNAGAGATSSEPSQPTAPVTFTSTAAALTPVLLQDTFTPGSGQTPAQLATLSPGAPGIGQQPDSMSFLFANGPLNPPASNASIVIEDNSAGPPNTSTSGNEVQLTNGVNSTWTIGGTGSNTLSIVLTGAPTPVVGAGTLSTAAVDWTINQLTGVSNATGPVNMFLSGAGFAFAPGKPGYTCPASIFPCGTLLIDPTGTTTPGTISFNEFQDPMAEPLSNNFFVGPGSPFSATQCAGGACGQVWYNQNTGQITIQPGLNGSDLINTGDPWSVGDFNGTVLASGTYTNAGVTATLSSTATVPSGGQLWFRYQSDGIGGTGNGNISMSTFVFNPNPAPVISSPFVQGAGTKIAVSFCSLLVPKIALNGGPGNWVVFDNTDSTVVSTGVSVVVDPNNPCGVIVTLNNNLPLGGFFFLQVAPNSVTQVGNGFITTTGQPNPAQNFGPWQANGGPVTLAGVTGPGTPPGSATTNNPTPTWTGTVTDPTGTVSDPNIQVSVDGAPFASTTDLTVTSGNGTGNVSFSYTPSTSFSNGSHTVQFQATDNNGAVGVSNDGIGPGNSYQFTENGTAASAANSNVTQSVNAPTTSTGAVPDDNITTAGTAGSVNVTVTLNDATNTPTSGKTVTLTAITNGAGGTITIGNAVTDGLGQAHFRVADNTAEVVTYQAQDTTDGVVLPNFNVTYVAPVYVSASGSGGTTTITVNFSDQLCRNTAWDVGDWTVSGTVSGAQTVNGDSIPICNGGSTNGVTTGTLSLASALPSVPQTWTVTLVENTALQNGAANSPASTLHTF
jgi:hypothetical protein